MTEHVITACTNMFIVFHYGKFNIFVDIKNNIETYEENKKMILLPQLVRIWALRICDILFSHSLT